MRTRVQHNGREEEYSRLLYSASMRMANPPSTSSSPVFRNDVSGHGPMGWGKWGSGEMVAPLESWYCKGYQKQAPCSWPEQLISRRAQCSSEVVSKWHHRHLGAPHLARSSGARRGTPCFEATLKTPRNRVGPMLKQLFLQVWYKKMPIHTCPWAPIPQQLHMGNYCADGLVAT